MSALLDSIINATEEDLNHVVTHRTALESELESVKDLERVLRKKLNKIPAAPVRQKRKSPSEGARRLINILKSSGGQMPIPTLANRADSTEQGVKHMVSKNREYLHEIDGVVHLLGE